MNDDDYKQTQSACKKNILANIMVNGFTFKSLDNFRKIYLSIWWCITILISTFCTFVFYVDFGMSGGDSTFAFWLNLICLVSMYYRHKWMVYRSGNLFFLFLVSIPIPFDAIILFYLWKVSTDERLELLDKWSDYEENQKQKNSDNLVEQD